MSDKLAEVVELTERKTAKVKFDGEESISEKEYPYLRSYVPKIGDKVFMKSFNGSYIIFDAISFEVEPDDLKTEITTLKTELTTQFDELKTELETNYTKTVDLEENYFELYLKKADLGSEIANKHTNGNGLRLIRSINSFSSGVYNINGLSFNYTSKQVTLIPVSGSNVVIHP